MEHKNLALVSNNQIGTDGNLADRDIESINNSLLSYSRKWNKEFINLSHEGDQLVDHAKLLNAQTSDFNRYLKIMYSRLNELIGYMQ